MTDDLENRIAKLEADQHYQLRKEMSDLRVYVSNEVRKHGLGVLMALVISVVALLRSCA